MNKSIRWAITVKTTFFIFLLLPLTGRATLFDSLATLKIGPKIESIDTVYAKISKQSGTGIINTLNTFLQKAGEKDDYVLEAMTYDMLGHYYFDSVSNGLPKGVNYYKAGIEIAVKHDNKILEAKLNHDLGFQYFLQHKHTVAFEYLLKANELMQNIGYKKYPSIARYLYELAFAYYTVGYYEKCILYLEESLKYLPTNTILDIWIYNTLALGYLNKKNLNVALKYFNVALDYSRKQHDTMWIGIVCGNIGGNVYMKQNEFDKALPLMKLDYASSMKYKEWPSAANCMLSFAQVSVIKGDYALARKQLDTAAELRRRRTKVPQDSMVWSASYYSILTSIFYKEQNWKSAYIALDSNFISAKHIWDNDKIKTLSQIESKLALEKHLSELKLIESERSKLLLRRNAIIVVLVLLTIITLQALRRMRLKQKKDREIYLLEVKRADEEVKNARQLLDSYTERLQKNSQLIQSFETQMAQLQEVAKHESEEKDEHDTFDKLNSITILREEDWLEFKTLFSKVYPDFFRRLYDKHPNLTQSETRFLALSRLGLSVKEMGHTLGVSPNTIHKTRERLRKKITITEQEFLKEVFPD